MSNYCIVQLNKCSCCRTFFKFKRKNFKHSRINIIDQAAFNNLLITMTYYSPYFSKTYCLLNFREILFYGRRHPGVSKCQGLWMAAPFCFNHLHPVNYGFVYIKIIETVLEWQVVYYKQKRCNANGK